MFNMNCIGLFALILNFKLIHGLNVLFLSEPPTPSHQIWNYELATGLLDKGYNVTMFGASPNKGHGQKNYHVIDIEGLVTEAQSNLDPTELLHLSVIDNMYVLYDWCILTCNYTVHSKGFQSLMNYPEDFKFDLIVADNTCGPCLLPLIQKFKYPPTVSVTAFLLPSFLSDQFGTDIQPSYLPFYLSKYEEEVSFFQRLQQHFYTRVDLFLRRHYLTPKTEEITREVFGKDMDSLDSLQNHVSLLLCNLIQGYHYSQPLTPNIIAVGGLHINPAKKLPADIQKIMDDAKYGVILFALGTNVKSTLFKEEKKRAILEAFGQLKQTVLWKFEGELEGVPKNVIIRKWLPQREILAHPNLRLFISHGGGLSTIEASYFGIPIVGIPFFADQIMNVQVLVDKKLAVRVEYLTMTSTILLNKINEVLSDPTYTTNAKKMSKIIRDQPDTPIDRAVFWMEYAIRHNGTHFLDPASRHLPLFVTSSMDIYLFILFISVVVIFLLVKSVLIIKNHLCSNKVSKKIKKN